MSRIHPTNNNNRCQDLSIKGANSGGVVVDTTNYNLLGDDGDDGDDIAVAGSANIINPPIVVVLTVWKRSSMTFQGTDGFTVFDQNGRLAFRVDNYSRNNGHVKGGLILMDGAGKALITLKPQKQILSMQWQSEWNGYEGESGRKSLNSSSNVLFTMRRRSALTIGRSSSSSRSEDEAEAEVFMGGRRREGIRGKKQSPDFRIEGSFWRRNCVIRSAVTGQVVAKIARKKVNPTVVLGDDVFSLLLLQPAFIDSQLIMAFLIILDRICLKPFTPFFCSS